MMKMSDALLIPLGAGVRWYQQLAPLWQTDFPSAYEQEEEEYG